MGFKPLKIGDSPLKKYTLRESKQGELEIKIIKMLIIALELYGFTAVHYE